MKPIQNKYTNHILRSPENWDIDIYGECIDLPTAFHNGIFYTWWKPTFWERIKIFFGKPIRLGIMSYSHPPVLMDLN